jgi:SAM-dependent methyltransferase
MEHNVDWNVLWRELVLLRLQSRKRKSADVSEEDIWHKKARRFDEGVKRKWRKYDSSRKFILSQVTAESTLLDIGAGTGAWAAFLAPHVQRVTALEPSVSMIEVMRAQLSEHNIANVDIVQGEWPEVLVNPHDFTLCSHAMYNSPDLKAFIRQMVLCTRQKCFLLLRAPLMDGIMPEAAQHIWQRPFDSPNFIMAYNILYQMGIYADVQMEDTGVWEQRTSASMDAALDRLKRHLGLYGIEDYDEYLQELLQRRLTYQNGLYLWPPEVRSALIYWQVPGDGPR